MFIKVHDKHVRHALLCTQRLSCPVTAVTHLATLLTYFFLQGKGESRLGTELLVAMLTKRREKGVDMTDSACSASVSVHMIRETRACVTPELLRANPTDRVRV